MTLLYSSLPYVRDESWPQHILSMWTKIPEKSISGFKIVWFSTLKNIEYLDIYLINCDSTDELLYELLQLYYDKGNIILINNDTGISHNFQQIFYSFRHYFRYLFEFSVLKFLLFQI